MRKSSLFQSALVAFAFLALGACGGGGGSSSPSPASPPPAPSGLSYSATSAFTINVAISTLSPTVTGAPTQYTVNPALPAGLTLNSSSGAISGAPTALQIATNYVVTASNAGGSTTTTVSIRINDTVPVVTYPNSSFVFAEGVAVSAISPAVSGGAVVQWSVDRALPAGLIFDAANGSISGTPTQSTATGEYVVSAINSGGSDTFNLTLSVRSSVLLELGHSGGVSGAIADGSRLLTMAGTRLVLWNSTTGEKLAGTTATNCELNCGALAGTAFAARTYDSINIHSSTDGSLLGQIAVPAGNQSRWGLAPDGSYVYVTSRTSISAWSPSGALLFSRSGDYLLSKVFAVAGELRIGNGPAGAQVIETISVTGNSTLSAAFGGLFHSWFLDGQRFLTVAGNVVGEYSSDATPVGLVTLSSVNGLGGQGDKIWARSSGGGMLSIYAVGNNATAVATFPVPSPNQVVPGKGTLAMFNGSTAQIGVIDLSAAAPVQVNYTAPYPGFRAFASLSAGEFWLGTNGGLVLRKVATSTWQRFNLGRANSIAGNSSILAIATDSGSIHLFNPQTLEPVGEIPFRSSKVEVSADGATLAARASNLDSQYSPDNTLRVYALPTAHIVNQWPYTFGGYPHLSDFSLSESGAVIGQVTAILQSGGGGPVSCMLTGIFNEPIWSQPDTCGGSLRLSPSASPFAVGSGPAFEADSGTGIYVNGLLASAVNGMPVGWVDDSRLLVARYSRRPPGEGPDFYDNSVVVNTQGQILATPTLPKLTRIQRLTTNTMYAPEINQVRDLTTGDVLWSTTSTSSGQGAVAGNYVIFASTDTVRAEPR